MVYPENITAVIREWILGVHMSKNQARDNL